MASGNISTLLLIIIAVFIPPLAVGLKTGIGMPLLINIILTILFYLPGLIHAIIVIMK